MKRILSLSIASILCSASPLVGAHVDIDGKCDVESRYDVEVDAERIGFSRKSSTSEPGARIEFVAGGIVVDGRPLVLSAADRERARQFRDQVQALVPQVRQIASDGVEIAFTALDRVVAHLASESRRDELRGELDGLRVEALQAIATARSNDALDDEAFKQRIGSAVKRIVPVIAGEFAAQAISIAMSGDEAAAADIERRANQLGTDIEASVEGAAHELEARAAALCPQIEALDVIDNQFEWRLPDGSKVDLLSVTPAQVASSG
jgi:hypothetical protein